MQLKQIIKIIVYSLVLPVSITAQLPIRVIKGFLQPPFNSLLLSPAMGALMHQSPYAKNLFLYNKEPKLKKIADLLFDNTNNYFTTTHLPSNIITHLDCEAIGRLIGWIYNFETQPKKQQKEIAFCTIEKIEAFFDATIKKIPGIHLRSHLFAKALIHDQNYLPHNSILLLQTCLWEKSNSQEDFIRYLYGLWQELNNKEELFTLELCKSLPTTQPGDKTFPYELFKKIVSTYYHNQEYTIQEFERLRAAKNPLTMADKILYIIGPSLFEKILPPHVEQSSSTLFQNKFFPDCGETSLLNFFAVILYNPFSQRWDIDLLNRIGATPVVLNFFQSHEAVVLNTQSAHNDWAKVVSNLPGVAYQQGDCDISAGTRAIDNMLAVIKHLIPKIENWNHLIAQCTQAGISINMKVPIDTSTLTGQKEIVITLSKKTKNFDFRWIFMSGHFEFTFPKETESTPPIVPPTFFNTCTPDEQIIISALIAHLYPPQSIQQSENLFVLPLERFDQKIMLIKRCCALNQELHASIIQTASRLTRNMLPSTGDDFQLKNMFLNEILKINVSAQNIGYFSTLYEWIKDIPLTTENEFDKIDIIKTLFSIAPSELNQPLVSILYRGIASTLPTIQNDYEKINIIRSIVFIEPSKLTLPLLSILYQGIATSLQTIKSFCDYDKKTLIELILNIKFSEFNQPILPILYQAITTELPKIKKDFDCAKAILNKKLQEKTQLLENLVRPQNPCLRL